MIYPSLTNQKHRDRAAREMRRMRQKRDEAHRLAEPCPAFSPERITHVGMAHYYKGLLCGYQRALQDFYDY